MLLYKYNIVAVVVVDDVAFEALVTSKGRAREENERCEREKQMTLLKL